MKYGDRIKVFRQVKKVSQLELELEAGLALGTISRIENNKINPTKETLLRVAKVLHLNGNEILELFCVQEIIQSL